MKIKLCFLFQVGFLAAVVLNAGSIKAQYTLPLNFGYQAAFVNYAPLNETIDRYNTTRSWLDKEMKNINYTDGLMTGLHFGSPMLYTEVNYIANARTVRAKGTPPGGEFGKRKLRFTQDSWAVMVGANITLGDFFVGVGGGLSYGSAKVKTKAPDDKKWNKLTKDNLIGSHFYLNFGLGESFHIRPYMYIPYGFLNNGETNVYAVETELDAANYQLFQEEDFNFKPTHFGIMLVMK